MRSATHYTVLGASGFIGSHLVALLEREGFTVEAPQRGSMLDDGSDYGHVVYCVGLTGDFRERPIDTARAHVSYLADVLERARFDSFTYLSSTRIYLGADTATEDVELRASPQRPDDLYNLTKLAGEALCLAAGGANARVARLSNVYGRGMPPSTFLSELVTAAVEHGEIVLRDHPDSEKDYVHVDDAVTALARIAAHGQQRIYNVASGINVSNRMLLEILRRETGCRVETNSSALVKRFPPIDVTRIRSEFGFSPRSVLDEVPGLIRSIAR